MRPIFNEKVAEKYNTHSQWKSQMLRLKKKKKNADAAYNLIQMGTLYIYRNRVKT